jgi:thiol-disulfide isomerase/thioredoxin
MNAIELGPLVLSGERSAILLGVLVFMIGASWLASRISPRFNPWSTTVALGGIAVARLAHVVGHWDYFRDEPWRALAVWQGGFDWFWVLPVVIAASVVLLRDRRLIAWAAAPAAASAMVWGLTHHLASKTEPLPPPPLTLAALSGPLVDLAAPADRPTVINLWATWCAPCRREMPALEAAAARHPEVRFLFVNQGEPPATAERFLATEKLALDHVLFDRSQAVARHYGTVGIPVTLFLHADGRLARVHTGEIAPEQIDAAIRRLEHGSLAARGGTGTTPAPAAS